jgi:putative ABC transport system substrate-binding protein
VKRRAWLRSATGFGVAFWVAGAKAQTRPHTVGYLGPPIPDGPGHALFDELRAEMQRLGWDEGRRVRYEVRLPGPVDSREARTQRLATLAREIVAAGVDVMVAMGPLSALAAKGTGSTIPIVFLADEPVENGLVSSLAHPGANLTGITFHTGYLTAKRMQLLTQVAPGIARVGYLKPHDVGRDESAPAAAQALKLELRVIEVLHAEDLDRAIGVAPQPDAWVIDNYVQFEPHSRRIVELVAQRRKPAVYASNDWVRDGGLMSYCDDREDVMRYVAGFVDRVLRGAKPADLPVEQPTRFIFALNLKTAKAMGLTIPQSLLLRADEVIE